MFDNILPANVTIKINSIAHGNAINFYLHFANIALTSYGVGCL
jgi:hypothetical protein